MTGKRQKTQRKRLLPWLLILALVLSFCTGCPSGPSRPPEPVDPESGGAGNGKAGDPEIIRVEESGWSEVQYGTEITTLNVVLVVDTSTSTLTHDPDRNWLEAACMFLNTLYASASKAQTERLPGSKKAWVGVVLYNDRVSAYRNDLMNLATKATVDQLKRFIRTAEIPAKSGDDALAEALDTATQMLHNNNSPVGQTRQEELSERSVILLFTDGYSPKGTTRSLTAGEAHPVQAQSGGYPPASSAGGEASAPDMSGGFPFGQANSVPDFGDGHHAQLETACNRAKDNNYEIFVLMINPEGSSDGGWEKFREISEYTKRNFMAKLTPMLIQLQQDSRFANAPLKREDFIWPENYHMLSPAFLSDPMFGGGVFPDPEDETKKVNYWMFSPPGNLMYFYASMAANMLAGSSAVERGHYIARIEDSLGEQHDHNCYEIEVPNGGVSALMCFFFSEDGISGINLEGPDPDRPSQQMSYDTILQKQDSEGWANHGTMRNDWYTHRATNGKNENNIVTLTIVDPIPGTWRVYAQGLRDTNRSLHAYTALVKGANVEIDFRQGESHVSESDPVTRGNFMVRVSGKNDAPLPKEFYDALEIECCATRIPPWIPIYGEADIMGLVKNPTAWLDMKLRDYKTPDTWLTQMSGGEIHFQTGVDSSGSPALTGQYDAPLPGLYYMTLVMTAGEGASRIDYSKSFWVRFDERTGIQILIPRVKRDGELRPPYLPEPWTQTANTPDAVELVLNIDESTLRVEPEDGNPDDLATVDFDPKDSSRQTLLVHSLRKGCGTLIFDVTTEYGDKWTLHYDVIVNR